MTEDALARDKLFSPLTAGSLSLLHRVVMPAMARRRASATGGVPTSMMTRYYEQRATRGGLIVCEPSSVGPKKNNMTEPGLYSAEQVNYWRKVTDAVHARGGVIVAQLANWKLSQPLDQDDVDAALEHYRNAAENAGDAGFDGVELLGKDDCFDLLQEVTKTLIGVWSASRVGVSLSPFPVCSDSMPATHRPRDEDQEARRQAVAHLGREGIAYLSLVLQPFMGLRNPDRGDTNWALTRGLRSAFGGVVIIAGDYSADEACAVLNEDLADAVAFGLPFIANPDLPHRLRINASLAVARSEGLHHGDESGYTDYPACSVFSASAADRGEP